MRRTSFKTQIFFSCFLFILAVINHPAMASDKLTVFVSILPQKYFVEQIGKSLVDVQVMVQPGANPATYEPKPIQMAVLTKAKLYFAVGVPFENVWLKKIIAANPKLKVIHTDENIEKIPMPSHYHEDKGNDHEYKSKDPHIWLSPSLVKIQAFSIFTALQSMDPDNGAFYKAGYDKFITDIHALDQEIKAMFSHTKGGKFMVFHPSWGYFAQAYGLTQMPVEIEGKNPKPAELKTLIDHAREQHIKVIFVQPQFSTKSAELVANEIGGTVRFADPLAENWLENLRKTATILKSTLTQEL